MADSESIMQLGIEAARAGDKAEARQLFRLVTREDPNNAQGWLWLAGVAEDREEKRGALERVVQIDPSNDLARKGLAALGGVRAAPSAAAAPVAAATQAPQPAVDEPAADAPPVIETPATTPRRRGGARQYDAPVGAAAAGAAARPPAARAGDTAVLPAADTDDYDLDDYRQPAPSIDDDRRTTVVVEDEEPRRRGGMAWLPILLGVGALLIIGLFLWQTFRSRPNDVAGTSGTTGAGTTATLDPGLAAGLLGATTTTGLEPSGATDVAALAVTASPDAAAVATAPAPDQTPISAGGEGTTTVDAAAPAAEATAVPPATAPGAEATAVPPATAPGAEATAAPPAAAPGGEGTAAPPATGQTTVVVVPPDATIAPPPTPTTAPPPPPPPPAAVDVAAANPAAAPNGTVITAGSWSYTYAGIKNIGTGSYGGAPPTRGQFQILLLAVGNNGQQPATIPDGFFVLKDAQGRVYDFNRAASVDYLNRFGGPGVAADVGADATFPNNGQLTSVPLLFDVPPDATNLVLLSRENVNQGFVIR